MPASYDTTIADGSTSEFQVSFPYISKAHVKVFVDGVQLDPDEYSWVTDTRVALVESAASLAGKEVTRQRVTPTDNPPVVFTASNLSHTALNLSVLFSLYVLQETIDKANTLLASDYVISLNGASGVVTIDKDDLGLGSVDNTSDASKPISTATQAALNAKLNLSAVSAYALSLVAAVDAAAARAILALGNVDNTSDAAKPLSNAVIAALAAKQALLGFTPENAASKGIAGGYAALDGSGKVPVAQLPTSGSYSGTWDASTNTPTIASGVGVNGQFWKVNVAGATVIDGQGPWSIGDVIAFNGTVWQRIPEYEAVSSVAGRTGAVALTKADVGLSNVDNTPDSGKPVSTAQAAAIASKAPLSHSHGNADITDLSASKLTSGTVPDAALPQRLVGAAYVANAQSIATTGEFYGDPSTLNTPYASYWFIRSEMATDALWGRLVFSDFFTGDTWASAKLNNVWQVPVKTVSHQAEADARYGRLGSSNELSADQLLANGAAVKFRSATGAFNTGVEGSWLLKYSDGNWYFDNYDGAIVFRGAGYAQSLTINSITGEVYIPKLNAPEYFKYSGVATEPAVDPTNDRVPFWDHSAQAMRLAPAGAVASSTSGVASVNGRTGAVTVVQSDVQLALAGDGGLAQVNLLLAESAHSTSNRAALQIGGWTWLQDVAGNGTRDTCLYSHALGRPTETTGVDGSKYFIGGQTLPIIGGLQYHKALYLNAWNLNDDLPSGFYDVENPVNGPWAGVPWVYLHQERHSQNPSAYRHQTATVLWDGSAGNPGSVVWQRTMRSGVWSAWRPVSGYYTPADFGASGASTPAGALDLQDAAMQRWLNCGKPLMLDQWYRISQSATVDLGGQNGLSILGRGMSSGIRVSGSPTITWTGLNQDNPTGYNADCVTFKDFGVILESEHSGSVFVVDARAGDMGSSMPGLSMDNVHQWCADTNAGPADAVWVFRDIRNGQANNCSGFGRYGDFLGTFMRLETGESGAPVEMVFHGCRAAHFFSGWDMPQAQGSVAYDDHQGHQWRACSAIAVDRGIWVKGGPEGFGELYVVEGCHFNFREVGVYGQNAGNWKITNNDFLGWFNAPTAIQGVALEGTSLFNVAVNVSFNTFRAYGVPAPTRIAINIVAQLGVSAHNRAQSMTHPFTYINGSVVQTDNVAY